MKKGLSIYFADQTIASECIKYCSEAGFDGIEPTLGEIAMPSVSDAVNDARELHRQCGDNGLRIPSLRGGRFFWDSFCADNKKERECTVEYGKMALDCLNELGGKVLLIVPGQKCNKDKKSEQWGWAVELTQRLGEEAQKRNVMIGLENVEALFPDTLEEWWQLLNDINHPHVGMYLDVGNVVWLEAGDPVEWLEQLQPWIKQIHFKDAIPGKDLVPLSEGDVSWSEVMRTIEDVDYNGWILTEPPQPDVMDKKFVQDCFKRLDKILNQQKKDLKNGKT